MPKQLSSLAFLAISATFFSACGKTTPGTTVRCEGDEIVRNGECAAAGVACDPQAQSDTCGPGSSCQELEEGVWRCDCAEGYIGEGQICEDINECNADASPCVGAQICVNEVPGYICTCADGYAVTDTGCEDIDECEDVVATCGANSTCDNSDGSFTCTCEDGFEDNGSGCEDIDECDAGTVTCAGDLQCFNEEGSYRCDCPEGYLVNGETCEDIDECVDVVAACGENATCANSTGSFDCTCEEGFEANAGSCEDIDECSATTEPCPAGVACTNEVGGFTCDCPAGTAFDGKDCVNECGDGFLKRNGICYPLAKDIAVGMYHACAVTLDDEIRCWGTHPSSGFTALPEKGQFFESKGIFLCAVGEDGVRVCEGALGEPPQTEFVESCTTSAFGCGIQLNGTLDCWRNTPNTTFTNLVAAANTRAPYKTLDCTYNHMCALTEDGSYVWCTGQNNYGQGTSQSGSPGEFVDVAVTTLLSCGLLSDGSISCWGLEPDNVEANYGIPSDTTDIVEIIGGGDFCGRRANGETVCWRYSYQTPPEDMDFVKLVASHKDTCGIRADGTIECWGLATSMPGMPSAYEPVALTVYAACAIDFDGNPVCSGRLHDYVPDMPLTNIAVESNTYACGLDSTGGAVCFGELAGAYAPATGTFASLHASSGGVCGLRSNGTAACWAYNATSWGGATPPAATFEELSVGRTHACGRTDTGTVQCWGVGADGEAPALWDETFVQADTGWYGTCGILAGDNSITCIGRDVDDFLTPPAGAFQKVSVSEDEACALDMAGAVSCWGNTGFGETYGQSAPPPAGETFIDIWDADGTYCGLTPDFQTLCWGAWGRPRW